MSTIFRRRSIRKFLEEEIPQEDIREILKAGMAAPSAKNNQDWVFIFIEDPADIERFIQVHPNGFAMRTAPVNILVCADKNKNKDPPSTGACWTPPPPWRTCSSWPPSWATGASGWAWRRTPSASRASGNLRPARTHLPRGIVSVEKPKRSRNPSTVPGGRGIPREVRPKID